MEISVYQSISTQKEHQMIYGTRMSILYNMGDKIVLILNIFGAKATFLLFVSTNTRLEEQVHPKDTGDTLNDHTGCPDNISLE